MVGFQPILGQFSVDFPSPSANSRHFLVDFALISGRFRADLGEKPSVDFGLIFGGKWIRLRMLWAALYVLNHKQSLSVLFVIYGTI